MATIVYGWNGELPEEQFPPRRTGAVAGPDFSRPSLQTVRNRVMQPSSAPAQIRATSFAKRKRIAGNQVPTAVEFHTIKHIDNTRLVRNVEPAKLRNLYKTAALGGVIAIFCMFYIYQHFRCIDLSFQLEDLKAKQAQAASLNGQLRLEIATLRDPHRIDLIARHQLGLSQPAPTQVREYAGMDGAEVAAARLARPNRTP